MADFRFQSGTVSLAEPKERIHFRSKVGAMDQSAGGQRDFDAFVMSAKGETSTKSFFNHETNEIHEKGSRKLLSPDSLNHQMMPAASLRSVVSRSSRLVSLSWVSFISWFLFLEGREIKTIGDSFITAFKCAGAALDYARALQRNTGHPQVRIRAGIHLGPLRVEAGDVFGGTVNFKA